MKTIRIFIFNNILTKLLYHQYFFKSQTKCSLFLYIQTVPTFKTYPSCSLFLYLNIHIKKMLSNALQVSLRKVLH